MTEWLAIIVICMNGECAFWADTQTPHQSKPECEQKVLAVADQMNKESIETPLMTCIPIRWIKV
jgi:hypothetical protein